MKTRRQVAKHSPEEVRALLKERIYGGFSALTSLLVLASHTGAHASTSAVWSALLDVVLAMTSLWAASLFAEFLAQLVSHEKVTWHDWLHMFRATWQIMVAGIPSVFALLLCAAGAWELHTAVWLSIWLSIAALGLFAWLAVRGTSLTFWSKCLMMTVLVGIGVAVVGLKMLAH